MARDAAVWFVMIDGQQAGPMSRAEVGLAFAKGSIDGDSFVWKEGMSGWLPGAEVPELAQLFEPETAPAERAKPPPPPPAAMKSKEQQAKKKSAGGMPTFDTSHFKVRDGIEDQDAAPASKIPEFSTSHFKVPGTPDESSLSLEMNLPFHKPGVSGLPEAATSKPATQARPSQAKEEDGDWSDRTNVEMLPFGERIHQERVASELFDATGEATNSSKPLDLSKFAAKEQPKPRPAPQVAKPAAIVAPPRKSKLPVIAIAVLVAAVVIATLLYLLD